MMVFEPPAGSGKSPAVAVVPPCVGLASVREPAKDGLQERPGTQEGGGLPGPDEEDQA